MASNPSIEHIGVALMAVGLLIMASALIGIFRAAQAARIFRVRCSAFGLFLVSLNGLRIGIKIHDAGVQGITALMIVSSLLVLFFAHKLSR
jgi:hypothetical protein